MITLWLATGLLGGAAKAAAPQQEPVVKGSYISVERKPRKSWSEDRADLRAIIERAWSDPSAEADVVQDIVAPAIRETEQRISIDWAKLFRNIGALEAAIVAYESVLAARATEAEEDDLVAMLLAA